MESDTSGIDRGRGGGRGSDSGSTRSRASLLNTDLSWASRFAIERQCAGRGRRSCVGACMSELGSDLQPSAAPAPA